MRRMNARCTMANTKNALAELAERLAKWTARVKAEDNSTLIAIGTGDAKKLQRIVAELAKIEYSSAGGPVNPLFAMYRLDKCRAIAEEGANDGK